ncbi:hypothetical protein AMATHDRAFT_43873 [Amanita thiersii Skay4041]|uniref:F-box domain-containing protein n=1 Tax=Amanita thiersii Skay4041 TaxID=703135 RepID=A0A2A9NDZ6_9AGAR|nr:hypothetical protein AMATHDRAFT_43873 [Amanita thiersii Skay4041]
MPFKLSYVCQLWRRICLSTPRLWAVIRIPLDFPTLSTNAMTNYISLMLRYSDPAPLTLSLVFPPKYVAFSSLLVQHVHRWQFVELVGLSLDAIWPHNVHAPLLKHLRISLSFLDGQHLQFPFASCPVLEYLAWPLPDLEMGPNSPIPWDRIKYLCLWNLSPSQAIHFLDSCPQLSRACFSFPISPNEGGREILSLPPRILVTQHHLNALTLYNIISGEDLLFKSLCLPGLSYLKIRLCKISFLAKFLRRSECALHTLTIVDFEESPAILFDILATPACASLAQLEVQPLERTRAVLPDRLLEALTSDGDLESPAHSGSIPVFCPNLIQLTITALTPTTPGLLGRMVESRFKQVNGLLESFTYTYYNTDKLDLDILEGLERMGYKLNLRSFK